MRCAVVLSPKTKSAAGIGPGGKSAVVVRRGLGNVVVVDEPVVGTVETVADGFVVVVTDFAVVEVVCSVALLCEDEHAPAVTRHSATPIRRARRMSISVLVVGAHGLASGIQST
jgi:hypothetical protein